MEPLSTFDGRCVALPVENIDTDQIIPARFLKVTDKHGLGDALFADWRSDPEFILNQPTAQGTTVLVAGHNFGCGSSREHAPWALVGWGFRAVVSTYFADIFRSNALKNGLLPIMVDAETHEQLLSMCAEDPDTVVTINLERQQLRLPDGRTVDFPIDGFSRHCLLNGVDQLGYLQAQSAAIAAYEATHPVRVQTQ